MCYGLTQKPFSQTRRGPHSDSVVQVRGHGPTEFVGAEVNSVRESTPQKISTGRPSQPHRPPGSMHDALPLGTMHLPLLSQPEVKPQRWPDGHCESFLQLTTVFELRAPEPPAFAVCALVMPHAAPNHRISATPYADAR
jgi:hypothetical protein